MIVTLGLLAGVFALGFAGMLLMSGAAAILIAWRFRSIVLPLLFLCGVALPIAPISIHNTRAEGQFILLTTHGGFNFYMGNHREATGYPLRVKHFRLTARAMLEDAHAYAEQQTGYLLSKAESSGWWSDQARLFWRECRFNTLLLSGKKIFLFWNFRDVDDMRMLEQLRITDPVFHHWTGTPFALFGIMGLIGFFYARGAPAPRLMLLTGMAGLVLFFITARYRLTLVPLMAIRVPPVSRDLETMYVSWPYHIFWFFSPLSFPCVCLFICAISDRWITITWRFNLCGSDRIREPWKSPTAESPSHRNMRNFILPAAMFYLNKIGSLKPPSYTLKPSPETRMNQRRFLIWLSASPVPVICAELEMPCWKCNAITCRLMIGHKRCFKDLNAACEGMKGVP